MSPIILNLEEPLLLSEKKKNLEGIPTPKGEESLPSHIPPEEAIQETLTPSYLEPDAQDIDWYNSNYTFLPHTQSNLSKNVELAESSSALMIPSPEKSNVFASPGIDENELTLKLGLKATKGESVKNLSDLLSEDNSPPQSQLTQKAYVPLTPK
jgi:hypothetical protein